MADQKFTPKGITPLPWYQAGEYPYIFGADALVHRMPIGHDAQCYDKTTRERWNADTAYIVHAANEYPKAIGILRSIRETMDPEEWKDEFMGEIDSVLSAAREVEEKNGDR